MLPIRTLIPFLLAASLSACLDGGGGGNDAPAIPLVQKAMESRIGLGSSHALVVDAGGSVWAWGANVNGQLGNGTTVAAYRPTRVSTLGQAIAVAGGHESSLALKADGRVWAWGLNALGYIGAEQTPVPVLCSSGYPDKATITEPTRIAGLEQVSQIASGFLFAVALKADGTVWTWGKNSEGQLGTGSLADANCLPTQITGLSGITAVSVGSAHVVALKNDGTVWAWGNNEAGQLGNGTLISSKVPVQVSGLAEIKQISASGSHSTAVDANGFLWSWGYNGNGEIGADSDGERCSPSLSFSVISCVRSPVRIAGLPAAEKVLASPSATFMIAREGLVWGWGASKQLGTTLSTSICGSGLAHVTWPCIRRPLAMAHLNGFASIASGAGSANLMAVQADGSLWAWGTTFSGELGNGSTVSSLTPVQPEAPNGVGTEKFNMNMAY